MFCTLPWSLLHRQHNGLRVATRHLGICSSRPADEGMIHHRRSNWSSPAVERKCVVWVIHRTGSQTVGIVNHRTVQIIIFGYTWWGFLVTVAITTISPRYSEDNVPNWNRRHWCGVHSLDHRQFAGRERFAESGDSCPGFHVPRPGHPCLPVHDRIVSLLLTITGHCY